LIFNIQRVEKKIFNILATRNGPSGGTDILKAVLGEMRRTCARDVWARSNPDTYGPLEHDAMVTAGWYPDMPREKAFPIQMSVRSTLFAALTEEEQEEWEKKSKEEKASKENLKP